MQCQHACCYAVSIVCVLHDLKSVIMPSSAPQHLVTASSHHVLSHHVFSIKAELSLQAEALALDLKVLWDALSQSRGGTAPRSSSSSPSSSSSSLSASAAWSASSSSSSHSDQQQEQEQDELVPARSVLSCQTFLNKLNRACVVFISWANELEENSVSLNDEIAKDKDIYRDTIGLR